ncbi:MAG TPA: GDP-L-fucose synthase [Longimicrobium sp.]|nr:GDP-L-fucose synthase [Longimicrobium sp.]
MIARSYDPFETAAHVIHPDGPPWPPGAGHARDGLTRAFWSHRRVLVTGGAGFLGSHVVEHLAALGCTGVAAPRSWQYDLTRPGSVRRLFDDTHPDLVIHLAARVGGIGANRDHPGTFFHDNLMMGMLVIEEARRREVEKVVQAGTVCAYPRDTPVPFREEDLWGGYPEETNAPYGIAKKALLVMLQAYRQQFGLDGIYLLPVNLYGPRDNFDLDSGHVIPALIRRMLEARDAGLPEVVLWGTGAASREFLHVEDAARGILLAAEHYHGAEPVNLGTGSEITIRDLAALVRELTGYTGRIAWDPSKPDGQPRRALDVTRAREVLGWEARTPLREGLAETIRWYDVHRPRLPAPPVPVRELAGAA